MATQGATLGRGTLHLPIWPLVAIVAGAAALMIGMTLIDAPRTVSTTSEQLPAVGISHVTPKVTTDVVGLENPGAYVAPAVGISHVTPNATTETFVGLENPGAYVAPSTSFATGLENPGAYPVTGSSDGTYVPKLGFRPGWGFEGNTSCGQCR